MPEPTIIIGSTDEGLHNKNRAYTRERLKQGKAYKDLSTIIVIPTRGSIPARVVESWWNLMSPMNNKLIRMFISGMEVGDAYNTAVETILAHPQLKTWKYMLTLEEDNMPPPDGLIRLYEHIEEFPVLAGLYFTKGEAGQPMIYGNPKAMLTFEPQVPKADVIQECNGTGMGFTLFDMKLFRDKTIPKPWFKTQQHWDPQGGAAQGTQDLHFMANVRKAGYRIASDNRVKVGHLDPETNIVW